MRKKMILSTSMMIWCIIMFCCAIGWTGQKLSVVASIFPLQEFAKAVGGDRVNVELLLPPGSEPHTWEPGPIDIININKAHIFIGLGAGMEPWINDILQGIKRDSLVIIQASEGLDLIHTEEIETSLQKMKRGKMDDTNLGDTHSRRQQHEGIDPHIWLDFQNDQKMIDKIVHIFSEMDPEGSESYIWNGKKYKEKLADLDRKYAEGLKNCERSEILLGGHSAFFYMARRYGLKQIPLYGISPDAEPKPREIAQIIDFSKRQNVKAIFFERLINNSLASAIAEDVGATPLALNPGVNLTKDEINRGVSFIMIMEKNLENLRKGLECE